MPVTGLRLLCESVKRRDDLVIVGKGSLEDRGLGDKGSKNFVDAVVISGEKGPVCAALEAAGLVHELDDVSPVDVLEGPVLGGDDERCAMIRKDFRS